VVLTTNDVLYGKNYWKDGNCSVYVCLGCEASVGTRPDGVTPLGLLADKEMKSMRSEANKLFDPLWKTGNRTRSQAYKWLAKRLGISQKDCHFGHFDKVMLKKAIEILKKVNKGGQH